MQTIQISDKISYIEAGEAPLSADVGILREQQETWLYDVGNGNDRIPDRGGPFSVVLSHFHRDHIGNLAAVPVKALYLSGETLRHIPEELAQRIPVHVVSGPVRIGNLHLFPLPSSHAKGCLGLEIDGTYAFVGDGLYGRIRKDGYSYNAQLLQAEIQVLKALSAPFLLVSHRKGLIRRKEEVLEELEAIYALRQRSQPEICLDP